MKTLSIRGSLLISDGSGCGCSGGDASPIGFGSAAGCGSCDVGLAYDAAFSFPTSIATPGTVGQSFVDLPPLLQFTGIEFLRITSSAKIRLRINPSRPTLTGSSTLPSTGVQAGAATFTVTDSIGAQYTATVSFSGTTNTPALVVSAINAALAAAGAPFPPDGQIARLTSSTQLQLVSPGIGPSSFLMLAAGAPTELGLSTVAVIVLGTSSDLPDTEGLVIFQFPRTGSPTRIQVSGTASLDIVVAGRVTA